MIIHKPLESFFHRLILLCKFSRIGDFHSHWNRFKTCYLIKFSLYCTAQTGFIICNSIYRNRCLLIFHFSIFHQYFSFHYTFYLAGYASQT